MLADIGAGHVPQLLVFNKLDALENERRPLQLADMLDIDGQRVPRLFVSSRTGEGLPALREHLLAVARQAAQAGMTPGHAPELTQAAA